MCIESFIVFQFSHEIPDFTRECLDYRGLTKFKFDEEIDGLEQVRETNFANLI